MGSGILCAMAPPGNPVHDQHSEQQRDKLDARRSSQSTRSNRRSPSHGSTGQGENLRVKAPPPDDETCLLQSQGSGETGGPQPEGQPPWKEEGAEDQPEELPEVHEVLSDEEDETISNKTADVKAGMAKGNEPSNQAIGNLGDLPPELFEPWHRRRIQIRRRQRRRVHRRTRAARSTSSSKVHKTRKMTAGGGLPPGAVSCDTDGLEVEQEPPGGMWEAAGCVGPAYAYLPPKAPQEEQPDEQPP